MAATRRRKSPSSGARSKTPRSAVASNPPPSSPLTNGEIADRLASLAQLLRAQGENPFKTKAYRRAAETIRNLGESIDAQVRKDADLTVYPGIGAGISAALREIVRNGTLGRLEALRAQTTPELAELSDYPGLDPKRVLRIYQQLHISSVAALKEKLESGDLGKKLGPRAEYHVKQALTPNDHILLYDADEIATSIEAYLRNECGVTRAAVAGDVRRRVEVVDEIVLIVAAGEFSSAVSGMQRYGGGTRRASADEHRARFRLPSGLALRLEAAPAAKWGLAWIVATGSPAHLAELDGRGGRLKRLAASNVPLPDEAAVYRQLRLDFIPPELREGDDEVRRAARGDLPAFVALADIRGELHAHSTSSDGRDSIARMAAGARARSYEYIGITDHSQSLKIAGGVSVDDLRKQIRLIDRLNAKRSDIRILKSAEVDILADGTLDYPDELLRALDYTVCSIHSRFALSRQEQTRRILRAMNNPHFTLLGHATGRLLRRRPGYDLDFERIVAHAKANGCGFEINASPDRLDLSAENARIASAAGVKIAICTDAHRVAELDYMRCGIDQARRAGLERASVLNCLSWPDLRRAIRRR